MSHSAADSSRVAALASVDIFDGLGTADLHTLSGVMRRRVFAPGETIFQQGASGSELYAVISGLVAVSVRAKDEEQIELSRVGAGAFFGEMALLEGIPRSASCVALASTECLILGADEFDALTAEKPEVAVGILDRMASMAASRLVSTGAFLTQMVQWGDAARRRAITDSATGLFNRRHLEENQDALVTRAIGLGDPLSFAMFDLDRFGALNERYGSTFGDSVILRVCEVFRRTFGEDDILVRYGGDEFCFIMQRPDVEAERLCEGVCAAVRSLFFSGQPGLRITCSIGVAHLSPDASTPSMLMQRADQSLYRAKALGRDRALAWPERAILPCKRDIPSIAAKNRVVDAVIGALDAADSVLIVGHQGPDEDCIASMVAFALLVTKFKKKVSISLSAPLQESFDYLYKICRYNGIDILVDSPPPPCSVLAVLDTPKRSMVANGERYDALWDDDRVVKIELDHHLGGDGGYIGDPGYRLVYECSSTGEIVGALACKVERRRDLLAKYGIQEVLSRNLVLAVLTGMVGDSKLGRYLKSPRERRSYNRFSAHFGSILQSKTRSGSGNYASQEQVFDVLDSLSDAEAACFRLIRNEVRTLDGVSFAVLGSEASASLLSVYGAEAVVAAAKALVDALAEGSGRLGLVGYYDDPGSSDLVQFRLRRCKDYSGVDLRSALQRMGITNGGGHPGAVGFRLQKDQVRDIVSEATRFAEILNSLMRDDPESKDLEP